jgi:hypothetical protein
MKTFLASLAALACLSFPVSAFAQTGNASVGGFVQDSSQAVVPGVTITAENTQTGVVSKTISNETGTYTILSLLPGTYRLSATAATLSRRVDPSRRERTADHGGLRRDAER